MRVSASQLFRSVAVATTLALSSFAADAATVSISSAVGTWSNITGSPDYFSNSGGKVSWGLPASFADTKNSFTFSGNAPIGPYNLGTSFTLGNFTYLNSSTYGDPLTGARLDLTIQGIITEGNFSQSFSVTPTYTFSLNTTDNIPTRANPNCCADIVTAVSNAAGSQAISFLGANYIFSFTSFLVNNTALSTLSVQENSSVTAQFRGTLTATTAVPGPIAGAGLIPLAGFGAAWFARRRKKRTA